MALPCNDNQLRVGISVQIIISLLIIVSLAYGIVKFIKYRTLYPLFPAKYNFGKRRGTFRRTMELMEDRKASVLVETGVARYGMLHTKSDGASTIVFGLWAKHHNALLYSVDIDKEAVAKGQQAVDQMDISRNVMLHVSDSVNYLDAFQKNIDFLYLDSYDYDPKDILIQKASQEHHLKEIKAAKDKLHDNSIVLIDDCHLSGGGKGKLAIKYLTNAGWKIDMNKYQVLLIKDV